MHIPNVFVPMLLVAMALPALHGCDSRKQKAPPTTNEAVQEAYQKLTEFYDSYLEGDVDQARRSLQAMLAFTRDITKVPPDFRAHRMRVAYCWLYVLEKKLGNDALAETYLQESRSWHEQQMLAEGVSNMVASKESKAVTADECVKWVDRRDNASTNGRGPRYAQSAKSN